MLNNLSSRGHLQSTCELEHEYHLVTQWDLDDNIKVHVNDVLSMFSTDHNTVFIAVFLLARVCTVIKSTWGELRSSG
jgi:hypothetical protein